MDGQAIHRIRTLPREIRSQQGQAIALEVLGEPLQRHLREMYLAYQPRNSFQGLPPLKDEICLRWVEQMIADGINLVAVVAGPQVVGHTALFPIDARKCELLVVVAPAWQNQGIGTELVQGCLDVAAELGFARVWLPVEAANLRARHIYQKCGFAYVPGQSGRELDMVLELPRPAEIATLLPLRAEAHGVPAPHFLAANGASRRDGG